VNKRLVICHKWLRYHCSWKGKLIVWTAGKFVSLPPWVHCQRHSSLMQRFSRCCCTHQPGEAIEVTKAGSRASRVCVMSLVSNLSPSFPLRQVEAGVEELRDDTDGRFLSCTSFSLSARSLRSIRGSFQIFRRSSQSSRESAFHFCGAAIAMVSVFLNFTADMTITQTL
jgi:hypothetical protein